MSASLSLCPVVRDHVRAAHGVLLDVIYERCFYERAPGVPPDRCGLHRPMKSPATGWRSQHGRNRGNGNLPGARVAAISTVSGSGVICSSSAHRRTDDDASSGSFRLDRTKTATSGGGETGPSANTKRPARAELIGDPTTIGASNAPKLVHRWRDRQ